MQALMRYGLADLVRHGKQQSWRGSSKEKYGVPIVSLVSQVFPAVPLGEEQAGGGMAETKKRKNYY
jgi:hypothetical protein